MSEQDGGPTPLTRRQREILEYLRASILRNGYAPTLEEIGRHFSLTSPATVHKHLENLRVKRWITRAHNRSRQIDIIAADGVCPHCQQPIAAQAGGGKA